MGVILAAASWQIRLLLQERQKLGIDPHHPSVRGETQSVGSGKAFSRSFMSFRSPLVNQESLLLATLRG
jgi:hypothetical protein